MLARSIRAGLVAVLVAAAGVVTSTSEAQPAAFSKVYMTTVVTQWSHWSPDTSNSSHAGTLYAASNYFYCYVTGEYYNNNGHGSVVWLRTDDDSGNRNVYVSDVNLSDYWFQRDVRTLPTCY
ncbi:hypothetical protein [Streptomyces sp. NPDC055056]